MKKQFLDISIFIAAMFFISSCGGGLSEEEKNQIEKFEIEWTANIDFANYLHAEISETMADIQKKYADPANDTLSDDSKSKYERSDITELKKIDEKYFSIKNKLEKENQDWMKFKQKAMNDELDWEEVEFIIDKKREILISTQKEILKNLKIQEKIRNKINS